MRRAAGIVVDCLIVLSLLLVNSAHGGEESEIIKVTAVGMGKDSDAALKNALKNAVSQAVGSIIDNETMVHNDEIIQDKILSHSGGFVEKYDIIGTPRAEDGLVSIKIDAEVKRMNLKREMETNNIVQIKKIDGKVFTRKIQLDEAAAMFRKKLEGFPEQYVTAKIEGEPYLDDKQKKFSVDVTMTLNTDKVKALIKDLIELLDAASPEPALVLRQKIEYTPSLSGKRYDFHTQEERPNLFYLPVFMNKEMTMATWKCYTFSGDLLKVRNDVFYKKPSVCVDLLIDGGVSIARKCFVLPAPFAAVDDGYTCAGSVTISPFLNNDFRQVVARYFDPGSQKITYTYRFDIDAEEATLIKDVKLSVSR